MEVIALRKWSATSAFDLSNIHERGKHHAESLQYDTLCMQCLQSCSSSVRIHVHDAQRSEDICLDIDVDQRDTAEPPEWFKQQNAVYPSSYMANAQQAYDATDTGLKSPSISDDIVVRPRISGDTIVDKPFTERDIPEDSRTLKSRTEKGKLAMLNGLGAFICLNDPRTFANCLVAASS